MAVVRRGKVWQAQVRVGKDPRTGRWVSRAVTCDTKAEAERAERQLMAEAESLRARWVRPTRMTLGAFLAEWLERKAQRCRPKTVEDYRRIVRLHIAPALGDTPLQELTPRQVQAWVDRMGPRRITEYARGVLVDALGEARRLGLVPDNAAARTEAPARAKPKRPSFTLEECQALFRAAEGERIGPLLRLLLYTGLRRGEALALTWEDVSWDPPALVVRRQVTVVGGKPAVREEPKTEAGFREVPLVAQAVEALREQRARQAQERLRAGGSWRDEGWVFADSSGGLWDPANVERSFRRVRDRAGVRALPLHALRHSAASVLLGAGVEPALAAKVLGHKNLNVFYAIYSDLLRPAAQQAARQVERFLAAAEAAVAAPAPAAPQPRRGRPRGRAG